MSNSISFKIISIINNNSPEVAADLIIELFNKPNFIVKYKHDDVDKELFWPVFAKNNIEANDLFLKSHDVLCEIISINPLY